MQSIYSSESPMRFVLTLLTVCLFSCNSFASNQDPSSNRLSFAASSVVVPVMANLQGLQGAFFKTQVSILNPSNFNYPIAVTLFGPNGVVGSQNLIMAPGQIRNYSNFLQEVFTYAGAGSVRFDSQASEGGSADFQFVVQSEVYWDTANGNYGTVVPALVYTASNFDSYSVGVNVSDASRTNIGCFNDSAGTNVVEAAVYDSSGQLANTVVMTLAAHSWGQMALTANVAGGYIRWRPTFPAFCYAVVVDNRTNDGNFILAAEFVP
jgi:hypothetical protein